ncbi:hypothetical protein Adt_10859 [Abeliophyllum distichum]|uniref:Uncharacterized protein n=1 Tax=Abeliophyllum distichum TaxID=126358 RepID=A0ABD1ULE2_9LAMI
MSSLISFRNGGNKLRSLDEYRAVCAAVDRLAADHYRHYKLKAHNHLPLWTEGDRLPDEYRAVCAAVDCLAADHYLHYKLKAHNQLKAHGPNRPYDEMSAEDWQKCIDFFTSPTFLDKLVGLRETQHTQVASNGASLDERAIAKEFSGDSQNNDPRLAMYEAQLHQMQREIEILKNRIPVVVPAEEENGDKDEGLEGP